jgi:Spy/CpxP family protein refolding chaperone
MHLKKMKEALTLTDQQVPKIRAIILDKNQKIEAVKTKYANSTDKKAMHEEMKMINDQKENELKAMLTPEQYAKHVQLKEEQKKKRMEKQKE